MTLKPTKSFKTRLRTMFYVPSVSSMVKEIARQIETKEAIQMDYELWTVHIFGIPATVIMWDGVLIGLRYAS